MREVLRRIRYLIRRRRLDADLAEEMAIHREMAERELEARGATPAEARTGAKRAFGSAALARDRSLDVWVPHVLQGVGQDVRYGIRTLLTSRVMTIAAVGSLGLGIGANAAIFSIINSLLLKPLPVHEPDRLVQLAEAGKDDDISVSYAVWKEIRDRNVLPNAFASAPDRVTVINGGDAAAWSALWASGRFFETLGVPAIAGRVFGDADDRRGGGREGPVAVISDRIWQRRYGRSPAAIGQTLTLERVPFVIVGVAPADFFGLDVGYAFDVILPLETEPLLGLFPRLDSRTWPWLRVTARLAPGMDADQIAATMRRVEPAVRTATMPYYSNADDRARYMRAKWTMRSATTGNSPLRSRYTAALLTLLVTSALVLLVACANIANLLLARITSRRYELSMRAALGASRLRLVRQLLIESLLVSAAGASAGLVFAQWSSRAVVAQMTSWAYTAVLDLSPDWRVLAVTGSVAIATTIAFGIAPAFRVAHVDPIDALKHQARGTASPSTGLGGAIVVAQVALSMVLVAGAVLFLQSFRELAHRDLGFQRNEVAVGVVNTKRTPAGNRVALYERLRQAAASVPGVESASASLATPLGQLGNVRFTPSIEVPDSTAVTAPAPVMTTPVSADWFRTFGTRIDAGREFSDRDRAGADLVAIVNQAFAHRYFGSESPMGRTIVKKATGNDPDGHVFFLRIVGVARDAAFASVRDAAEPTIYTPLAQDVSDEITTGFPYVSISVRVAHGSADGVTRAVTAALARVDGNISVEFRTVQDQLYYFFIRERLLALLSGFFGVLALVLAGLGLAGVTAYAVARRRTEIGIRAALGAGRMTVLRLVLGRLCAQVCLGLAIGTLLCVWASRFVSALLFHVAPRDPAAIAAAAGVLAVVALVSGIIPAHRAASVDPATVLRD